MKLTKFSIYQLFGSKNYEIEIRDNKLVLVAENGAGKTTILKIIYLFLSAQWHELSHLPFSKASATIDEKEFEFIKANFDTSLSKSTINKELRKHDSYKDRLENIFSEHDAFELNRSPEKIADLTSQYDLRPGLLRQVVENLTSKQIKGTPQTDWKVKVLFFPTYRNLENEFGQLYPGFDERIKNYLLTLPAFSESDKDSSDISNIFSQLWEDYHQEKRTAKTGDIQYKEMIEFGMKEVENRIFDFETENTDTSEQLKKLLFACNTYLMQDKHLSIKDKSITLHETGDASIEDLNQLASGEQQILSMFSMLYLDDSNLPLFVLIDEPELSLSISWQRKILNDVLEAGAIGVIASTHSPFTYNNEQFDDFMYPLDDFIKYPN